MKEAYGVHFRAKVVKRLFAILLIFIVVLFFGYANVFAVDNISIGYFGSTHVPGVGKEATVVLPAYPGYADALPNDVIYTKQSLYEFLVNTNLSADAQKRTGSAYIVCTMLGQASAIDCINSGYLDSNRTVIYPTAWDILHSRLVDNADVVLHSLDVSYPSAFRNTMWDPEENDVFSYDKYDTTTRATIALSNAAGTIDYYRIFRACANPLGGLGGLPTAAWSAEPRVQANIEGGSSTGEVGSGGGDVTINIAVGQTVRWNNIVIINNGPVSILYSGEKSGAWGGTSGPKSISGSDATNWFTYTIQASDAGKTYCSWTAISSSSPGGPSAASKSACVYVVPNWKISPVSSVKVNGISKNQAAPGDTIVWTHEVKNDGPTYTTDSVFSRLAVTGISGWSDQAGDWTAGGQGIVVIRKITDYATYKVKAGDVGKDLCEQIKYQRNDSGAIGEGNDVCVSIPYSYTLTPAITINQLKVVEDGSTFTVTNTIENDGATKSKLSDWDLEEVVTYPNGTIKTKVSKGSGDDVIFDQNSTKTVITLSSVPASGEAGTKYCYTLSVSPKSGVDDGVIFDTKCITIGKKPKVQITGGNLLAGGSVNTSTSTKNSRMFGSWTEYGVFSGVLSVGTTSGMASGSAFAFADSLGLASPSICKYSTLSFTNVPSKGTTCTGVAGTIGNYRISGVTADIAASFPGDSSISGSIANDLLPSAGTFVGSRTGNLTLAASTLDEGKSIILKVKGTVTISGNQSYNNGPYEEASQLPQLIIIADNINITDNVTNIDAWLIAKNGNINTCSNFSGALTVGKCNQLLTVNGPVIANKLFLNRTAGSETGDKSGNPAEIFNLRADAYLWAAAHVQSSFKVQSVYTTELPPRF